MELITLSSAHNYSSDVNETLSRLNYLDSITVVWIDASQSAYVAIPRKGVSFENHNVETRVSSTGQFLGVQEGLIYNDSHILLLKDISDQRRGMIQSIPLQNVKSINLDGHGKEQLMSYKDERDTIRLEVFVRKCSPWGTSDIQFPDHSTKRPGGW